MYVTMSYVFSMLHTFVFKSFFGSPESCDRLFLKLQKKKTQQTNKIYVAFKNSEIPGKPILCILSGTLSLQTFEVRPNSQNYAKFVYLRDRQATDTDVMWILY